jgi:hypothetical protein
MELRMPIQDREPFALAGDADGDFLLLSVAHRQLTIVISKVSH